MSWRPNDYVPNPQSDRDSACMQMRLAKVAPTFSKSSYNPNITKTEDSFSNSIVSAQQFSNGSRFAMPDKKNISNSNKTRFEGFQA
jgi:hypothetical protein